MIEFLKMQKYMEKVKKRKTRKSLIRCNKKRKNISPVMKM